MGELIKNLYDVFKIYSASFYHDLILYNFAVSAAIGTLIASFLIMLVYYKVVDKPNWAKISIWGIFMLINGIAGAIIAYVIANNTLVAEYAAAGISMPSYGTDFMYFALTNFLFALIIGLLFSVGLKYISTNSSTIPF